MARLHRTLIVPPLMENPVARLIEQKRRCPGVPILDPNRIRKKKGETREFRTAR